MTGYQLLLVVLLTGSVILSLVGAVAREIRWMSAGVALLALTFLCQNVHSLT